jgi:hypothetical protein
MSIGEFARRSRLSAKALLLYDELDLLPRRTLTRAPGIAITRWISSIRPAL